MTCPGYEVGIALQLFWPNNYFKFLEIYLALISWIYSTIWVTYSSDLALSELTVSADFGETRLAGTGVTSRYIVTVVSTSMWYCYTFIDI